MTSTKMQTLLQKTKKIAKEGQTLSETLLVWRLQISFEQATELIEIFKTGNYQIPESRANTNNSNTNLLAKAQTIIKRANQEGQAISITLLKTKMNISYIQAAELIELLVQNKQIILRSQKRKIMATNQYGTKLYRRR